MDKWNAKLNMSDDALVKPQGDFTSLIAVLIPYPTAAEHSTVQHKYGIIHDVSNPCILDILGRLHLVAPHETTEQHSTFMLDAFPRRIDRLDYKAAGASAWIRSRAVVPKTHKTYWEGVLWDAYRQLDARFVFLVGAWAQNLFEEWLEAHLLIADRVGLPWDPNGRPACYLERTSPGSLKRIIFLVPHPEAYRYRRYRSRDESTTTKQLHSSAFRERFFDLVKIYMNNDVVSPAFLSSAKIFRYARGCVTISPLTFLQKDSDTLAALLCRPGLLRFGLEDHLKANIGSGTDYIMSIFDKVHTTPSQGPTFWLSQDAVDRFGPIAVILKKVSEFRFQQARDRIKKNKVRRTQDPNRHKKACGGCQKKDFLCMRGPRGQRPLGGLTVASRRPILLKYG